MTIYFKKVMPKSVWKKFVLFWVLGEAQKVTFEKKNFFVLLVRSFYSLIKSEDYVFVYWRTVYMNQFSLAFNAYLHFSLSLFSLYRLSLWKRPKSENAFYARRGLLALWLIYFYVSMLLLPNEKVCEKKDSLEKKSFWEDREVCVVYICILIYVKYVLKFAFSLSFYFLFHEKHLNEL